MAIDIAKDKKYDDLVPILDGTKEKQEKDERERIEREKKENEKKKEMEQRKKEYNEEQLHKQLFESVQFGQLITVKQILKTGFPINEKVGILELNLRL